MCKTHGRNACLICEFTMKHGKVILPPTPVDCDIVMQNYYAYNWRDARPSLGPVDENDEADV